MLDNSYPLLYKQSAVFEDVELRGHILDEAALQKVLDDILRQGGDFEIKELNIGKTCRDPSYALLSVKAAEQEILDRILVEIAKHGAKPIHTQDCRFVEADIDGAFPEDFYSTTNQHTDVRLKGRWVTVEQQEMDCGICVEPAAGKARCLPVSEVRRGDLIVVGRTGIRVLHEVCTPAKQGFVFMASEVSSEKPKETLIREIACCLFDNRNSGGKTLLVGGPAIVHTGCGRYVERLIRGGYVHLLFAGNALAAHDIEHAFYGTSLGVLLEQGKPVEGGHEHHLRAINRIRRAGGIRRAVETGLLRSGVMYECVRHGVDFLLAGSIRDDGPLPEVVTDVLQVQRLLREKIREVTFCLMLATMLHSVAVGNLLPAWVKVVCVDINPATVTKLADRGSFQTFGLVTDVAPFLRVLTAELEALENAG